MNTMLTSTSHIAMRTLLLSCVLATGLAGSAMAGEGGGDPFAASVPGVATAGRVIRNAPLVADVGAQAYPDMPAAYAFAPTGEPVMEANGQQGAVQTANSLPSGAMDGTVAYARQQSVNRYYAQQPTGRQHVARHGRPAG